MATDKTKAKIFRLTQMGMLTAISIVLLMLIHFPIFPAAAFLEYDMADVPVIIGTMLFGVPGVLTILLLSSVIQAFLLGGNGWVGLVMHFVASGALVVIAGLCYHKKKTVKGLVVGLILGTIAMTALMVPLNYIFTVNFFGVPKEALDALLWPAVIPFNLIKAGANSVITALVFIPVRRFLKDNKN